MRRSRLRAGPAKGNDRQVGARREAAYFDDGNARGVETAIEGRDKPRRLYERDARRAVTAHFNQPLKRLRRRRRAAGGDGHLIVSDERRAPERTRLNRRKR